MVWCNFMAVCFAGWWSGVVVSALASNNEVNLRRARLVLRWATVSGFSSRCRTLIFRYVTNQPPKVLGVGKWVTASAGKAKAGMVHSVSGWTQGVQVKLWDPSRTRAIPERLKRCDHDEALYKSTFTFTNTPALILLRLWRHRRVTQRWVVCLILDTSGPSKAY